MASSMNALAKSLEGMWAKERNRRDPVTYVCPEMWTMIFEILKADRIARGPTLEDSNDVKSCSAACATFQEMLHDSRAEWLFPEVLPFLFPYIDCPTNIIDLRKICKIWKLGVDSLIQYENTHFRQFVDSRRPNKPKDMFALPVPFIFDNFHYWWQLRIFRHVTVFTSTRQADEYIKKVGTDTVDLPGQTLCLHFEPGADTITDANTHWNVFTDTLINMCGSTLRVISLHVYHHPAFTYPQFYKIIHKILHKTPQLSCITITGNGDDNMDDHGPMPELDTPLPPLPNLYNLDLAAGGAKGSILVLHENLSLPLQQTLTFPYASQIKRLCVNLGFTHELWLPSVNLASLEELNLNVILPAQLESLLLATDPPCPLKRIVVVVFNEAVDIVSLGEILTILERFGTTLKELTVDASDREMATSASQEDVNQLLNFPNLEYLQLSGFVFTEINICRAIPRNVRYLFLPSTLVCADEDLPPEEHTPWMDGTLWISKDLPHFDMSRSFEQDVAEFVPQLAPEAIWINVFGKCAHGPPEELQFRCIFHRPEYDIDILPKHACLR